MDALLSDGTTVVIREIRASDKALLAAGFGRLSDASRRRRFLASKPRLSSAELRYLTEVDGVNHYAIVAVVDRWDGEIAAVGRVVRLLEDPTAAEAAIVVGDCHQGQGLGKQMAVRLADAARERGITRIVAQIHSDNVRAHRLMELIGARLELGRHQAGSHDVIAELAA